MIASGIQNVTSLPYWHNYCNWNLFQAHQIHLYFRKWSSFRITLLGQRIPKSWSRDVPILLVGVVEWAWMWLVPTVWSSLTPAGIRPLICKLKIGMYTLYICHTSWKIVAVSSRAFRIGQSRDVIVYRLITEGTVEEMVYLRQVYKQVKDKRCKF